MGGRLEVCEFAAPLSNASELARCGEKNLSDVMFFSETIYYRNRPLPQIYDLGVNPPSFLLRIPCRLLREVVMDPQREAPSPVLTYKTYY